MRDEFMRLTDVLGKTYEGVDFAAAQAEIDEAVSTARKARARRSPGPRKVKKP